MSHPTRVSKAFRVNPILAVCLAYLIHASCTYNLPVPCLYFHGSSLIPLLVDDA